MYFGSPPFFRDVFVSRIHVHAAVWPTVGETKLLENF